MLQEDLQGGACDPGLAREDYETARYASVNEELLQKNLTTVRVFSNNFPSSFCSPIWGRWRSSGLGLAGYRRQALYRGPRRIQHPAGFHAFPDPHDRLPLGEHLPRGSLIPEGLRCPDALDVKGTPPDSSILLPPHGVDFDDVSFRYPGSTRDILDGVSWPQG